jgi:hypothetical protein
VSTYDLPLAPQRPKLLNFSGQRPRPTESYFNNLQEGKALKRTKRRCAMRPSLRLDTASLTTVPRFTAEAESRCESTAVERGREMEEHIEEWLSGEGETPGDNPAEAIIADDVDKERESSSTEYDRA